MIDAKGFRHNVGIILTNKNISKVFWGKRVGHNAWQFPQGGVDDNEDIEECLYRELREEIGLEQEDVSILAVTHKWLYYKIPPRMISSNRPYCVGQKQKWFLLKLNTDESKIRFDLGRKPEFDDWCWVNYWYPLREVINFKKEVYRKALRELAPTFFNTTIFSGRNKSLNSILDK